MAITSIGTSDFTRIDLQPAIISSSQSGDDAVELAPVVNLQAEINDAAEEMADILSAFGRFSRAGRKNDSADNDFVSSMCEEKADEKFETLVRQVARLRDHNQLINFARSLFPNDSDLMLALRELLLSRQLTELQKKKIKESIADLEKFGDTQKMKSGMNVGRTARRFSEGTGDKQLSAKDLRNSYLRFLELDLPAGFIYQDWIDEYGYRNRKRLLAFTLAALVADMKASEPGIHFDEFGPLSAKLSDARVLHTMDKALLARFAAFPFGALMANKQGLLTEEDIVKLYMTGIIDFDNLQSALQAFSHDFMSKLFVNHRATVIQTLRDVFNTTPEFLYASVSYRNVVLDFMSELLTSLYAKERTSGIWNEHYK
ncbi:HrpJ domain-containing protein [Vagococcus sp. WN89Y]|uniref:HrpJ domain-containing protein n=1 Tax=Vagococcus sp. WN89Y TaxID=3457258 RepID=UPI003FCD6A5D